MKSSFFLLILILLCSGCKTYEPHTSINMYGTDAYFPQKKPQDVKVFHHKPPGDYTEIGELTVEGTYSMNYAKEILKRKAAAIGGDAVFLVNIIILQDDPYGSVFNYNYHRHPHKFGYNTQNYINYEYTITGVIIRYKQ